MPVLGIYILGLIIVMLFYFTTTLIYAINRNMKTGKSYREGIRARVEKLPLHKVIQSVGINTKDYLYNRQVVQIDNDIRACTSCEIVNSCDPELAYANKTLSDTCPNYEGLSQFSDKKAV